MGDHRPAGDETETGTRTTGLELRMVVNAILYVLRTGWSYQNRIKTHRIEKYRACAIRALR
jgi:hypothetical protein